MKGIFYVILVEFDITTGHKITKQFPEVQTEEEDTKFIVQNCMPDLKAFELESDTFYFNIGQLFCYVHFWREIGSIHDRNCKQQSIVLVTDIFIKDIEFLIAKMFDYNIEHVYVAVKSYLRKIEIKSEDKMPISIDSSQKLPRKINEDETPIEHNNSTEVAVYNLVQKHSPCCAHDEFKCYKFLKDKLEYLLEATICSKKLLIISQRPSKLSKFKNYLDKIVYPCTLSDYYVFISCFNDKRPTIISGCGLTHTKSRAKYKASIIIDLDNNRTIYNKKDYKWISALQSFGLRNSECPLAALIAKYEKRKTYSAEKQVLLDAFVHSEIYQKYIQKTNK